jgi:hypothetical protein
MKGRGGPRWSNGAAWRSCREDLRHALACSVWLFTGEAAFERAQDVPVGGAGSGVGWAVGSGQGEARTGAPHDSVPD